MDQIKVGANKNNNNNNNNKKSEEEEEGNWIRQYSAREMGRQRNKS